MSNNIVWSHGDPARACFWSPLISNAQRPANGNTLVNKGVFLAGCSKSRLKGKRSGNTSILTSGQVLLRPRADQFGLPSLPLFV
jgi:hypothetical protein